MFRSNNSKLATRLLLAGALTLSAFAQPPSGPSVPDPMTPAPGTAVKQGSSPLTDPNMRRVGEHLRCLCGCKATVTSCDMMECRYSGPARTQIVSMQAKGEPDNAILAWFAKQQGLSALMAPPAEGFYAVGWVMPFIGLLFGFIVVYYLLRRLRRPMTPAIAGGPPVPPQTLDRYRAQIDRDLAQMEE